MVTIGAVNDARTRARLSPKAVKAFFRLTDLWKLNVEEQLDLLGSSISRATLLGKWKGSPEDVVLNADQMMRLSYLLGIYEGLQRIWRRTPREADAWPRRPNTEPPLLGDDPISHMRKGGIPAMARVRAYLDWVTGGPPSREWYPAPPREG